MQQLKILDDSQWQIHKKYFNKNQVNHENISVEFSTVYCIFSIYGKVHRTYVRPLVIVLIALLVYFWWFQTRSLLNSKQIHSSKQNLWWHNACKSINMFNESAKHKNYNAHHMSNAANVLNSVQRNMIKLYSDIDNPQCTQIERVSHSMLQNKKYFRIFFFVRI